MTNATLFTQPGCGGCIFAAKDLRRAGIQFTERNVRVDPDAAEMVQRLYQQHRDTAEPIEFGEVPQAGRGAPGLRHVVAGARPSSAIAASVWRR